jgi:hypothetical protein
MDIYLSAAFEAEKMTRPEDSQGIAIPPEAIKQTFVSCRAASAALSTHRKEHGC